MNPWVDGMQEIQYQLPVAQMQRLQFLTGDHCGNQRVDLPGDLGSMEVESVWSASWEPCDRYLHITNFVQNVPMKTKDSLHTLITYDEAEERYLCHIYPSSSPDRVTLHGQFHGHVLVFEGLPAKLIFGFEKVRISYWPLADGFEMYSERCEVDGWVPFCSCQYVSNEVSTFNPIRKPWPPRGFTN